MERKKGKNWKEIEGKEIPQNTNMDYAMFLHFKFSYCCAVLIIRSSSLNFPAFLWGYSEPMFTFSCHLSNFSSIQEGLCKQPRGRTNSAQAQQVKVQQIPWSDNLSLLCGVGEAAELMSPWVTSCRCAGWFDLECGDAALSCSGTSSAGLAAAHWRASPVLSFCGASSVTKEFY